MLIYYIKPIHSFMVGDLHIHIISTADTGGLFEYLVLWNLFSSNWKSQTYILVISETFHFQDKYLGTGCNKLKESQKSI